VAQLLEGLPQERVALQRRTEVRGRLFPPIRQPRDAAQQQVSCCAACNLRHLYSASASTGTHSGGQPNALAIGMSAAFTGHLLF